MKLDLDCVRDVMLCAEENTGYRNNCVFIDPVDAEKEAKFLDVKPPEPAEYQKTLTDKYGLDMFLYHVNYCIQAGLLCADEHTLSYQFVILDLTPYGHQFLENIRPASMWEIVKSSLLKAGSTSLKLTTTVAENVASQFISNFLMNGLPQMKLF